MAVNHVVLFGFKPDASSEAIMQCCHEMLSLKDRCTLASTGKPYIMASKGGKDTSIEGLQNGLTHAFVVEFASVADRDYYVKKDEAHRGFVEKWFTAPGAILAKAVVVDFLPGSF